MKINSISNIPFKQVYLSKGLRPGSSAFVAYRLADDIRQMPSYLNLNRDYDCDVYIKSANKRDGDNKLEVFLINSDLESVNACDSSIIKDICIDCPETWDDKETYDECLNKIDETCKSPNLFRDGEEYKDYNSIFDFADEQIKYGWYTIGRQISKSA